MPPPIDHDEPMIDQQPPGVKRVVTTVKTTKTIWSHKFRTIQHFTLELFFFQNL